MTETEMFEKSFERPTNFFKLPYSEQWQIDSDLGILDWSGTNITLDWHGTNLTKEQLKRFAQHYA